MGHVLVTSPHKVEADLAAAVGSKNNNGLLQTGGHNGNTSGLGELQKAADKITLMSPEVFELKPKIKEEALDEMEVKVNVMTTPSAPTRGSTLGYMPTRQILAGASGTSSPSREVADILGAGEGDDEIGKIFNTKSLNF